MNNTGIELLSPAKNISIGISAIDCGADAVYIAGPSFGAREAAGNSFEDLKELVRYAHQFGAKIYLTLNTILYNDELDKVEKYINKAYDIGVDALIIQDLGILKMDIPPIALYASTQTNIRTVDQARFLESLGFKKLILARELSIAQIKAIRQATKCELEAFIHGALCVSYSGQCYMSQYLTGRSGNRGLCVQACRSLYDLEDLRGNVILKNKPILSLKDLNLSNHLKELVDAGVTSFKIEGRLKNASYVKNVTRYYRKKLDEIIEKKSSHGFLQGGFNPRPEYTFNRGYTELFIDGERGKWNSRNFAKSMGEYVGEVVKILNQGKFTEFIYKGISLSNGDGICFTDANNNVIGVRVETAVKSNEEHISRVKTKNVKGLKPGVRVYRNYNILFEKELENNMPKRFMIVNTEFVDDKVLARCENGISVSYSLPKNGEIAKNADLALKNIKQQFSKVTDIFKFQVSKMNMNPIRFMPLSELNAIRRELAKMLSEKIRLNDSKEINTQEISQKKSPIAPKQVTNLNCSNDLSKAVYEDMNISPDSAYELKPVLNQELMRTKYCIRYELGKCPKYNNSKSNEDLILVNNGKRFRVKFDCKNCEMIILAD